MLVDYQLTFTGPLGIGNGTGVLELDLPTFTHSTQINYTSFPSPVFSSLTATIGGVGFDLTNQNATGLFEETIQSRSNLRCSNPPRVSNCGILLETIQGRSKSSAALHSWKAPLRSARLSIPLRQSPRCPGGPC